ncbi:MAG: alpha/beta hydrolase fold domain-containing protein [Clostridia bacterium]|nr:alpha/beta hydrolase fold domain-containing protein [Clostridia bacterium]
MKRTIRRIIGMALCLAMTASALFGAGAAFETAFAAESVTSEDLESLISGCSYYRSNCWTDETWSSFVDAYNAAVRVASSPSSSAQIVNAYDSLCAAKASLVHDGDITKCAYCCGESLAIPKQCVLALSKVTYSTASTRCFMDMYIPTNRIGNCGLIVFIHGGGWTTGSNKDYSVTAREKCIEYGVATIAINYRYASESTTAFDILNDIGASVAKAKECATEYGLNLDKLILSGTSAGAHLAMLYAYSRADSSAVKPTGVVEYSGPSDLSNPKLLDSYLGEENMSRFFSYLSGAAITDKESQKANAEALLDVSPVKYVTKDSAPTIICHGTRDIVVDYSEAENIANAFKNAGATYELLSFNANHSINKDEKMLAYSQERFYDYVVKCLYGNGLDEIHDYSSTTVLKTCTTPGYTFNECPDCGKYYVSDVVEPSHDVVVDPGYPATCTEDGLSDGSHCSSCNTVLTQQEAIPATGHTVVEDAAVAPTCVQTGLTAGSHCSVCNAVLIQQEVIDPLGHKYDEGVVTAPTCTSAGFTTYTCTVCGDSYTQDEVASLGHDVVEDEAVAPTCTETGLTAGTHCARCEAVLEAQETVAALGHNVVEDAAVAPTCTETGLTAGTHCARCRVVLKAQETVTALGHDVVEDEAVAPTCTETGLTAGTHCARCGDVFTKQDVIPANGHQIISEVTVPATYTATGTRVTRCVVCSEVFETETIPVIPPEYSVKEGSSIQFDDNDMLIMNINQGTFDLSKSLNLEGCTLDVSDSVVSTGSLVTIKSLNNDVVAEYCAVVVGDLTGDGFVDSFDLAIGGEYVNSFTDPEDIAIMKSFDFNDDGYLDATDLVRLACIVNFEVE